MEVLKDPFDPKAGKKIKSKEAARWTKNYRTNPGKQEETLTLAHYFGKEFLLSILNEDACAGLRIYQAIDDEGASRLLVVGVDAKGKDLISPIDDDGDGAVGDTPMMCPDNCDPNSPLMQ
ncbi:hypothetical protein [Hymenobacter sp. HDW8]|uniref:hypothetical protein n=1 Tax=Hymenobacter sp. HDW8 TaxID=2714932 RepID=UPI001407D281|nr:hypothetical protein [Hymenobacter sp. HDW8]QIL77349.1 hypothetical protein G7064_16985 [Hymenobacter sp. HDW8]